MSELAAQPDGAAPTFSRLDVGMLIVLVGMAVAGVAGIIAVLAADSGIGALGTGFGLMFLVAQAGGTIACALACLVRGRAELGALGALVATAVAVDLAVIAVWLGIDLEAYGKLVGVAYVWMLFGLILLGLTLAVPPARDPLARTLYRAAVVTGLLGGAIATVLIVSGGGNDVEVARYPVPVGAFGDEGLLRPLGAALVVLAVLWIAALAASRVERAADD